MAMHTGFIPIPKTQASHVNATDKSDNTSVLQVFPLQDLSYKPYPPEESTYMVPLKQTLEWSRIPRLHRTEQIPRQQQSCADLLQRWTWHLI